MAVTSKQNISKMTPKRAVLLVLPDTSSYVGYYVGCWLQHFFAILVILTLLNQQWQLEAPLVRLVATSSQNMSKMTSKLVLCLRRNSTITEQKDASVGVWVCWTTVTLTETINALGRQAHTVPSSKFNGESKNGTPGVWFLAVLALEGLKVQKCLSRVTFWVSRGGTILPLA